MPITPGSAGSGKGERRELLRIYMTYRTYLTYKTYLKAKPGHYQRPHR
jgi:hypothetical protein